jgi:predicted dehydrogenase
MDTRSCRWGILGTAHIARKNWQAIALAGNAALIAVASRSLERSRQFVADCQASCPQTSCSPVATWTPSTSRCRRACASLGC